MAKRSLESFHNGLGHRSERESFCSLTSGIAAESREMSGSQGRKNLDCERQKLQGMYFSNLTL